MGGGGNLKIVLKRQNMSEVILQASHRVATLLVTILALSKELGSFKMKDNC